MGAQITMIAVLISLMLAFAVYAVLLAYARSLEPEESVVSV
jgi:hypothetical protein